LPIPPGGRQAGVLVAVGDREIEEQFVALLTVCSARLWDLREELVRQFIGTRDGSEPHLRQLVKGTQLDCHQTAIFFERVLSLSRDSYQRISNAAVVLHQAIRASVISYDAAFTMSVFALESLVPDNKNDANWSYFPEPTKQKLDDALEGNKDIREKIRAILLDDANFKLQARFVRFVTDRVDSSYFRSPGGVRRSDLQRLLRNAYSGRSGFVHALTGLARPLTGWGDDHMMIWKDREPHFTLQGILFLAFKVIRSIVRDGPHLPNEDGVPWEKQLPGVVTVPLAHQYWLWKSSLFRGNDMRERFSDVLEYLNLVRTGETKELVDLRDGIETSIKRLDQLPQDDRRRVLAICVLWSWIAPDKYKIASAADLFGKHKAWLDTPSIESLVLHVWGGFPLPWEPDISAAEFSKYLGKRYHTKGIKLPAPVESAIRGEISNGYLAINNVEGFIKHCKDIADDEGGRPSVVEHMERAIEELKPVDISLLLGFQRRTSIGKEASARNDG
jgi:hypothetical protein